MIGSKVFWENDLRLRMKNLSEMAVSLQGKTSIFTYRTLISSCVGGARTNPPTYEIWAYFLMCLALNVPIFNKKSLPTRAVKTFKNLTKVWKFPQLVSNEIFCWKLEVSLLKTGSGTAKDISKKKRSLFWRRRFKVKLLPLPQNCNLG